MQKHTLAIALLAALPMLGAGTVLAQESPFSANVSLTTDYAYRGISQTDEKAALQGGFDYAHSSGFYAGVWGSNISWLNDIPASTSTGSSLELDLYAGYSTELGPIGLDVGVLQYYYPGNYNSTWRAETGLEKPDTLEGYVGLSWEFLSFKYSNSFTDLFGAPDSEGSQYFDLSAEYEVMDGLTVDAHYGHQAITGVTESYYDWKVGGTYNLGGFDLGLHYVDTDIDDVDVADERVIFSVAKSF